MSFQKQIQNLYEHALIDADAFLLVVWLGRSYYSGAGESLKVYREVVLAQIEEATYRISDWIRLDTEAFSSPYYETFKIDILENEVITVLLGNIYNYQGILINSPIKRIGQPGLSYQYINITGKMKIKYAGLFSFLKNSSYPCYLEKNIYENAPYYKYHINNTDYLLPIHVINSFFYYRNTECVDHIAYGKVYNNFQRPELENNDMVIPYVYDIFRDDVVFFSRFFFIKGNEDLNCIRKISNELMRKTLNSSDVVRCYMQGGFPFKGFIRLKVRGQYIRKSRLGNNKFIIYDIIELVDYPRPIYTVSSYYLKELPSQSLKTNLSLDQQILYKKRIDQEKKIYYGPINNGYLSVNDSVTYYFFMDVLDFEMSYSANLLAHYKKNGINKETIDFNRGDNVLLTLNNKITKDMNLYLELFRNIVDHIGSIRGYDTELYEVKMHTCIERETYPPIILCACIISKGFKYYILEYGPGYSIPIFRHKNRNASISYQDIERIIITIYKDKARWKRILFEQQLGLFTPFNNKLYTVSVLNHPNLKIGMKKAQQFLKNKICENIANDINVK